MQSGFSTFFVGFCVICWGFVVICWDFGVFVFLVFLQLIVSSEVLGVSCGILCGISNGFSPYFWCFSDWGCFLGLVCYSYWSFLLGFFGFLQFVLVLFSFFILLWGYWGLLGVIGGYWGLLDLVGIGLVLLGLLLLYCCFLINSFGFALILACFGGVVCCYAFCYIIMGYSGIVLGLWCYLMLLDAISLFVVVLWCICWLIVDYCVIVGFVFDYYVFGWLCGVYLSFYWVLWFFCGFFMIIFVGFLGVVGFPSVAWAFLVLIGLFCISLVFSALIRGSGRSGGSSSGVFNGSNGV